MEALDLPLARQRMVLTTAGSLDELTSDEPHRREQQGGLNVVAARDASTTRTAT